MNKRFLIGLVTCVISGQPLVVASEGFDPETEMEKLLGRYAKKTSVITTPPRNKVVYDPSQLLSPGFMKAIQAQDKILQGLAMKEEQLMKKDAEIARLKEEVVQLKEGIAEKDKVIANLEYWLDYYWYSGLDFEERRNTEE